mgnify:CR=1 FL=1
MAARQRPRFDCKYIMVGSVIGREKACGSTKVEQALQPVTDHRCGVSGSVACLSSGSFVRSLFCLGINRCKTSPIVSADRRPRAILLDPGHL